jgi:hypothetical protein
MKKTLALFMLVAFFSLTLFNSCGSGEKDDSKKTAKTEKSGNGKQDGAVKPAAADSQKPKPIALTGQNFWGEKIKAKGGSLANLFFTSDKKKGTMDIYYGETKLQTVGLKSAGFDAAPGAQVVELLAKIPRPLTNEEFWGAKIKEKGATLTGLLFTKDKKANTVDIYFKGRKIQTMGLKSAGFEANPGQQAKLLIRTLKKLGFKGA